MFDMASSCLLPSHPGFIYVCIYPVALIHAEAEVIKRIGYLLKQSGETQGDKSRKSRIIIITGIEKNDNSVFFKQRQMQVKFHFLGQQSGFEPLGDV